MDFRSKEKKKIICLRQIERKFCWSSTRHLCDDHALRLVEFRLEVHEMLIFDLELRLSTSDGLLHNKFVFAH